MTQTTRKETYFFDGHGQAFSGRVTSPLEQLIEVQAGASLPVTGGFAVSRAQDFNLQEIASFKAAHSQVSGTFVEKNGAYETLISSTVEGLNILDVVTADRLVARTTVVWKPGEAESRIAFIGSQFDNLRLNGVKIETDLNADLLVRWDTFAALTKEFESNRDFRKISEDPFQSGQLQQSPEASGVFLCSLVKEIKSVPPAVERRGNVLIVPHFGRIYLGEIVAQRGRRSLIMLRVELGCPVTGTMAAAGTVGGGPHWP